MSSTETQFDTEVRVTVLWDLTLQNSLVSAITRSSLPIELRLASYHYCRMLGSTLLSARAQKELRELLVAITDALAPDSGPPLETGQPSPSPKASPSPTAAPTGGAQNAETGVDSKTEWIVCCGSAGTAPNPRFDNELDAIARYYEEMSIPSYIGPRHRRRASVIKVTTTTENVIA